MILGLLLGEGRLLTRLLSLRVPVYLGRISYGTYLWHWPVILVLIEFFDTSSWVLAALTVALASGLAALSYEVVELPIRKSVVLNRYPLPTVVVGVGVSAVLAFTLVAGLLGSERKPALAAPVEVRGDAGRIVPDVNWFRYADDKGPDDTFCTLEDTTSCVVATGDSGLSVALVGDSHARMFAPAMIDLAERHDFTLSLNVIEACSWQNRLLTTTADEEQPASECTQNRQDLYGSLLNRMDIDVVVLTQMPRDRGKYLASHEGLTADEHDQHSYESMQSTLTQITDTGTTAVIVRPTILVPEDSRNPLECLSGARRTGECVVPTALEPAPSDALIQSLELTTPGVEAVTINDLMCPDAPLCEPLLGDVPVWRDRRHYTPAALQMKSEDIWDRIVATSLLPG